MAHRRRARGTADSARPDAAEGDTLDVGCDDRLLLRRKRPEGRHLAQNIVRHHGRRLLNRFLDDVGADGHFAEALSLRWG